MMTHQSIREGRTRRNDGTQLNMADFWSNVRTGFHELRTAEYNPLIEVKSSFGLTVFRDIETETNSGTVGFGGGEYQLSTGTTADSEARLTTIDRGSYIAGIDAVAGLAVRLASTPTGEQEARWGYYDDDDGIGFGMDSSGMFVFIRKGGTETKVARANWDDPLDGTGDSGLSISPTDMHIYRLPFRWYGSGPAGYQVSVVEDSRWPSFAQAHTREPSDGAVIFESSNLPIRAEVTNGATTEDLEMFVGGRQFGVFGRYNPSFRIVGEHRTGVTVATSGFTPLIAFQLKSAFRDRRVKASGINVLTDNNLIYELRRGGSLTGASFGSVSNLSDSETAAEVDTSATAYSGGEKMYTGLATSGQGNRAALATADLPDVDVPTATPVVLCAQAISAEATVDAVARWREEWALLPFLVEVARLVFMAGGVA